jgi:hypothetical protein
MKKKELSILVSPAFITGLSLLLLNDFLFKSLFHNWLTGKLSDFAGLFIFPLFFSALFPARKRVVYWLTAILFIFWKSPASQPLIDLCNTLFPLPVGRVVDPADLLALLLLPFSYVYSFNRSRLVTQKFAPYFVACVSLFAFTATQYVERVDYGDRQYVFAIGKPELVERLMRIDEHDDSFNFRGGHPNKPTENPTNEFYVDIKPEFCSKRTMATIEINDQGEVSVIVLKEISHGYGCEERPDDKEKFLAAFERDFIAKINLAPDVPK